jgi:hypothetical protein
MKLMTAHRILIASSIAMFAFLTLWEVRHGLQTGEVAAGLVAAVLSAAATAGLAVYYRYRFRKS